jgi:hypothetical protein
VDAGIVAGGVVGLIAFSCYCATEACASSLGCKAEACGGKGKQGNGCR